MSGHKAQKPETITAQALGWIDAETHAVAPVVHASSTYLRDVDNQYRTGRAYARADNPAYDQPEAVLAALEKGEAAMLFASGMAAATAVFQALAPGDHVVAPKVMYWGFRHWLIDFARNWGLEIDFVDMCDLALLKQAVRPGKTRLVWLETPANPLWDIVDIAAAAEVTHAAGARLAVDSTVATPVFTRPIEFGADLVMHSATKYLNGHSDLVAGALVTRAKDEHWERIAGVRARIGGILGSFEAWLLLRGMRTLFPRVRMAAANAQTLAHQLAANPHVSRVLYPGLPEFPGHAVAARQMKGGFGGMMSIRVKGGERAAIATAAQVGIWKRATSLGGVESLIEHRASVEGADTPCPPDLLRLSVGIEDAGDLLADLETALAIAHG
ncbi:MAG: aminotransferase class I/II-fold pyridoxal phosphate-dependent enzyme [Alphaproteobacteria bacterium]|nr:aminotransferase class I/II-fold pyridoxal phosphate-dependent enzyme [Alphaproteobacteria bacterium]